MSKYPRDAPIRHVIAALEGLAFELIRDREHVQMWAARTGWSRYALDYAGVSPHQGIDASDDLHPSRH